MGLISKKSGKGVTQHHQDVAVGVLLNDEGQVFITQRRFDAHLGGFWEFPGGKCNADEPPFDALVRELNEEIDIRVMGADLLETITQTYGNQTLELHFFIVRKYAGVPFGRENQPSRWVFLDELSQFHFPAANLAVIERLRPTGAIAQG